MRLLRNYALWILTLLGICLLPPVTHADPITDLTGLDANFDLTYKVESSDNGVGWGHGTGEVIWHDGYILTQYHVIDDAVLIRVRVRDTDGKMLSLVGTVVAGDPLVDLAVVKVNHRFTGEVELADPAALHVGDAVYSVGYPYSAGKSVDRGYIKQLDFQPDPSDPDRAVTDHVYLDIPDGHGTSGSCIFTQKTGQVIGTMKEYMPFGQGRSPMFIRVAVPVTVIQKFLDDHRIPYRSATRPATELPMRNPQR